MIAGELGSISSLSESQLTDLLSKANCVLVLLGAGASHDCEQIRLNPNDNSMPLDKGALSGLLRFPDPYPWLCWALVDLLVPNPNNEFWDTLDNEPFPKQPERRTEELSRIPLSLLRLEDVFCLLETYMHLGLHKHQVSLALEEMYAYLADTFTNFFSEPGAVDSLGSQSSAYRRLCIWLQSKTWTRVCNFNYDTLFEWESYLLQI